jgi:hypothetical protein
MKYLIIWLLLLVAACSGSNNNVDLDGVYTASFEHEFAKTEDTLIIKKANDGNGVYQITRHSGVIKTMDGKIFPKEILTDTWTLEYNADKHILTELKDGKTFIWDSNKLTLQFGETTYKKISGL